MDDQYRSVVLKDATEAARGAIDSLIPRAESLPLSARGLWWDAFLSSMYAAMLVSLGGDQERAIGIVEHVHENACSNIDFVRAKLEELKP